jgi:GAF domain-containing protein
LAADVRWAELAAKTEGRVRAVLAVPVRSAGAPVGSLHPHVDRPRDWDDIDKRAIVGYAAASVSFLSS